MCHSSLLISLIPHLIGFVTLQQEDGIIHSYSQLKDRRQCLCDIRNLTKDNIGSQVINNGGSDSYQEDKRCYQ